MAKTKSKKPYELFMVFGDNIRAHGCNSIERFAFATKREQQAFLEGVDAMQGWSCYDSFSTRKQANAHVKAVREEWGCGSGDDEEHHEIMDEVSRY
jgi:hypothetical protein